MDTADLRTRFRYHKPKNSATETKHENIRAIVYESALRIDVLCPDGREKSLAITKLEEAMMWANAAIARNTEDS